MEIRLDLKPGDLDFKAFKYIQQKLGEVLEDIIRKEKIAPVALTTQETEHRTGEGQTKQTTANKSKQMRCIIERNE